MRAILFSSILVLSFYSHPSLAEEKGPLTLKAPADVKLATELHDEMTKTTEGITACAKGGKDPMLCRCEQKVQVLNFSKKIQDTVKQKPAWKTESLLVMTAKGSFSMNMPGLVKMSEMDPCAGVKK